MLAFEGSPSVTQCCFEHGIDTRPGILEDVVVHENGAISASGWSAVHRCEFIH